jgi:two-component system, NtrC family, sensor kinase
VKAEEALKLSEQNFRNSVDSSSMGIHIVDTDFKTLYANQALIDIFGYHNLDEVRIIRPFHFYTPESYREFELRNARILRNEPVPDKVEVDIIRRDGTIRHLQVFRREVFWDGKRQYQTLYNDITEQKTIETSLRESEEKYRTIFESANDIILVMDTGGKILDVNARLTDIGGYQKDELIGKQLNELTGIIVGENMDVVAANYLKLLAGAESASYKVEMIKKNREPIYLEVNAVPIRKEGKVIGIQALLRDITERNKSELVIKEQKALTDRILESIPASVVVVGQDKLIVMVNKAFEQTFAFNGNKAENQEIGEIIRASTLIDTISQVLAGGKSQHEIEFKYKNSGLERVFMADIIRTRQNEAMAIISDITEGREMQERLYLTDRLASLGEMAAGIAHELNNPLTGVVALSQLLLEAGVPPEIKDDLEAISSEGQRAASVVKNLLSFARSHTLSAQPVEINAVISQVLNLRAYEHRVNNIEVVTHFAPNLPEIVADRFQMQQVFLNIVLNAEQAMIDSKGRGSLTVTTELSGDIIRIAFADNGPGIPADIINRIFDPFFTTKEVGKGTGLGLSICYGIVTKQGGRIFAQSQPGQGATFIIELPLINPN